MLDAIDPDEFHAAVEAWRPDPQCLADGDEYVRLAVRCYAGALSDQQIKQRFRDLVGVSTEIDTVEIDRHDAAIVVARHCAMMGLRLNRILAVLAYLAAEVPCWPDAHDIAEIAVAAFGECEA